MSRPQFTTIRTEGGLLPPGLLARVAAGDPTLPGHHTSSYHLADNERFGEIITRSWLRLTGAWAALTDSIAALPSGDPATGVTRERWLLPLFSELGYGRLPAARGGIDIDGVSYPISHLWGNVPIHLVGAGVDLDRRRAGVAGAARWSPHSMVQELLNADTTRLWGFVSNGLRLRILRDNHSLTRQAFVEFDLQAIMDGEAYSDFVVLWLLCHQSRVEADPPENCWLERWSVEARTQGTRALDHLRDGVEAAIATLGTGFLAHPANSALRAGLQSGDIRPIDYYRQLLRVIYRLLFLLVAEERDLLLLPGASVEQRRRNSDYYSLRRIRDLAERRRGGPHADLWAQLNTVIGLLGSSDGGAPLGLPALGSFLFSDAATPALNGAAIANADLLTAIRALSGREDERGRYRQRFDYRNLGVEELGSVYESLLELHPEVNVPARRFALTHGGSERRATGSHYTPPAILKRVLDFALDPAIARARRQPDPETALLDLRVLDPACGSGHFLTAAAHRIARALASVRSGEIEATPDEVRHALRDVVVRCIYGIDLNPMAVELCRVALWLETLEPGKPLSFLDHHIRVGNSLVGVPLGATVARNRARVEAARKDIEERIAGLDAERRQLGALSPRSDELAREVLALRRRLKDLVYDSWADAIPDAAFKPIAGDDTAFARRVMAANKRQRDSRQLVLSNVLMELPDDLVEVFAQLGAHAEQSVAEVTVRAEAFDGLQRRAEYRHLLDQADAWTAAWFWPLRPEAPTPPTQELFNTLKGNPNALPAPVQQRVGEEAEDRRFFHLELAFPELFTSDRGGFDVCVGNPPYLGGMKISSTFGDAVHKFLKGTTADVATGGRVDLAAYFLRRGFDLLRPGGHLAFVTTNTVGQGDTRDASLVPITRAWGGDIADAVRSEPWVGQATVSVAMVHLVKGLWGGRRTLDGTEVPAINPDLSGGDSADPVELTANKGTAFAGTNVLGEGFWLTEDSRRRLLAEDPRNAEVIKPFIGGRHAMQMPDPYDIERWVIDFGGRSLEEAATYAGPMRVVLEEVKPQRDAAKEKRVRENWWMHGRPAWNLYERIASLGLARVVAIPEVSKTMLPVFLPADAVYQHKLVVFTRDDDAFLGLLTSSFHWLWAAKRCTTMRTDPTYNPGQIFMTFAQPVLTAEVADAGRRLEEVRKGIGADRQLGVTGIYNLVTDPAETAADVSALRRCHQALDETVGAAYGWGDLDLTLGHHPTERFGVRWTVAPTVQREIERRLLQLNLERSRAES